MRAKNRRDRLIRLAGSRPGWTLGFADEVWFSRLAQPALHAWAGARPRLSVHAVERHEPEAKALACYGLWQPAGGAMAGRGGLRGGGGGGSRRGGGPAGT